jgi:hypothetical protein
MVEPRPELATHRIVGDGSRQTTNARMRTMPVALDGSEDDRARTGFLFGR